MRTRTPPQQPPTPLEECRIFDLISQGKLPPATSMTFGGAPTWDFPAIASLLGISQDELLATLAASKPRFVEDRSGSDPAYYPRAA